MAAKGQASKDNVRDMILKTFEGAFIASDGKTIRVPMTENGETVEIKVALTAAKDIEGNGAGAAVGAGSAWTNPTPVAVAEPTAEELENVNKLAAALGF